MTLDHELSKTAVVLVAQGPRRLLGPEYLRDHVPRPAELGLIIGVFLQQAQTLSRRLPQARLAQPLGGLVAVPAGRLQS